MIFDGDGGDDIGIVYIKDDKVCMAQGGCDREETSSLIGVDLLAYDIMGVHVYQVGHCIVRFLGDNLDQVIVGKDCGRDMCRVCQCVLGVTFSAFNLM